MWLDELPEFRRDALEVVRQPLEDGIVNVARVFASYAYPADFCLIAAMNPCPCGYYGDVFRQCTCTPGTVQKYQTRIFGPLLDHIDLHIEVTCTSEEELLQVYSGETSATIGKRVCRARELHARRFAAPPPPSADPADANDGPPIRPIKWRRALRVRRERVRCSAMRRWVRRRSGRTARRARR